MTNPTYHLEGIIKNKDEMEDFEGPLNLILMLLSKNKVEIKDIQISVILEQYLDHIAQMQELDLEVASEFVQMASHLVYIKTRTLLAAEEEEITELEMLIQSLEQLKAKDTYSSIKAITESLGKAYEMGVLYTPKPPEPIKQSKEYVYKHTGMELLEALLSMYSRKHRLAEEEAEAETRKLLPVPIIYGVREKSRELIEFLLQGESYSMKSFYQSCKSRSELVATFISVLELCAAGTVMITNSDDDIVVSYTGSGDIEEVLQSIDELEPKE